MSWQSYIDTNLLGAGLVHAQIIGQDGSSWATSPGFGVKGGEAAALVKGFSTNSSLTATGIIVSGVKYLTLKTDERSVYGKKDTGGIVCTKTNKAVIIGVYDQKLQPGAAVTIVEKLADYLIDQNF